MKDHPRACGEKSDYYKETSIRTGSPPRMRGKDWMNAENSPRSRITPAHAGKSSASSASTIQTEDHPRACGEKDAAVNQAIQLMGSPPRMRGKVIKNPRRRTDGWDHPRACGEKLGNNRTI